MPAQPTWQLYKRNTRVVCYKLTAIWAQIRWQFSKTYYVPNYGRGWKKDVVNQCLESGLHVLPSHTPKTTFQCTALTANTRFFSFSFSSSFNPSVICYIISWVYLDCFKHWGFVSFRPVDFLARLRKPSFAGCGRAASVSMQLHQFANCQHTIFFLISLPSVIFKQHTVASFCPLSIYKVHTSVCQLVNYGHATNITQFCQLWYHKQETERQ